MYAYTVYTANLLRQDFKIAFQTTYYIKWLVSNIQYVQLRSTKGNLFRNKKNRINVHSMSSIFSPEADLKSNQR